MAKDKGHQPGANVSKDNDREIEVITKGKDGWTGKGVSNFGNASDKAQR